MIEAMVNLAGLIKRLRQTANISEVARLAKVDRSTVTRIRDGENAPNMATFESLMAAVQAVPRRKAAPKKSC